MSRPKRRSGPVPRASSTGSALLSADRVTVRFGGLLANDDVSLHVAPGEVVGLVGPNGAGKTTLFNVLCGLVDPVEGRVVLDGHDVTQWPPHRRALAGMARTFQRLEVFGHLTVLENLMIPLEVRDERTGIVGDLLTLPLKRRAEAEARAQALDILELVGIAHHADRLASQLPLGLNRLVELGRALAASPRIILLDEPSSGMDTAETDRVGDVLRDVAESRDVALLLVEHDVGFVASLCERVYVLDFGKVIADGTPDDIQRDPVVLRAYLGGTRERAASARRR